MQRILQHILPFELPQSFPDDSTYRLYKKWDEPARQVQISAITFLTALLYIIFTLLDKSWASEQIQILMLKIYLFAVVPLLLSISFLAYKQRFYNIVMPTLMLFPVFSLSCHVYIASKLSYYTPFLTEGYLGVLWIFVVSGLTFRYALISASMSSTILLVSGFYLMTDTDMYTMHVFWIFCSFSFGFLGALTFDRSRKAIFMSQQELHHMAITDELTGAFNRNHLNNILTKEMARDIRYDTTFGLLMIDIDHFKNINDTFGHAEGDKVLRKTAQRLSTVIRSNDTLVRWGGEEFVVIAIEVDENTLEQLCEKLRTKIADDCYGCVDKVTVSIGATLFRKGDSQDDLLSRADKALYEAKAKGRNLTVAVN
jgi:diguanylate cyclase